MTKKFWFIALLLPFSTYYTMASSCGERSTTESHYSYTKNNLSYEFSVGGKIAKQTAAHYALDYSSIENLFFTIPNENCLAYADYLWCEIKKDSDEIATINFLDKNKELVIQKHFKHIFIRTSHTRKIEFIKKELTEKEYVDLTFSIYTRKDLSIKQSWNRNQCHF